MIKTKRSENLSKTLKKPVNEFFLRKDEDLHSSTLLKNEILQRLFIKIVSNL